MSTQGIGNAPPSSGGYLPPAAPVAPASPPASDVAQPRPQPPVTETVTREQVQQAVAELQSRMKSQMSNNLQFSLDDETGKTIVRVTDGDTGELIRQIPSEELVAIAKALDKMQGLLLHQKA